MKTFIEWLENMSVTPDREVLTRLAQMILGFGEGINDVLAILSHFESEFTMRLSRLPEAKQIEYIRFIHRASEAVRQLMAGLRDDPSNEELDRLEQLFVLNGEYIPLYEISRSLFEILSQLRR